MTLGAQAAGSGLYFTPVPNYLVDMALDPSSDVTAPCLLLYAHIVKSYAWMRKIFPSYDRLAVEMHVTERTVRRLMAALKDAGAITWGARTSRQGRSTNEYAIAPLRPFDFDRGTPQRQVADTDVRHHPDTDVRHHPDTDVRGSKKEVEVRTEANETLFAISPSIAQASPPAVADGDFDRFWALYPKKIGKPSARKAWRAAIRRKADPQAQADPEQIICFMTEQAAIWARPGVDQQYIPYPASWLNDARYNDPLIIPRQMASSSANGYAGPFQPPSDTEYANMGGF